jgi:hypothetical protein
MRILITNDDGINAPGLEILHAIATEVAGPEGEVWTVAPAFEQSGVGHCISYVHPTMIAELGPRRFAAEGSPADCVLAALNDVLTDAPPDLVLSGVNRGNNAAENVLYSGTIGGAMEAALQGLPAIALSQYFGPDNAELENPSRPPPSMAPSSSASSGTRALGPRRLPRLLQRELPARPGGRRARHAGHGAGLPPRHRVRHAGPDRAQRAAASSGSPAAAERDDRTGHRRACQSRWATSRSRRCAPT